MLHINVSTSSPSGKISVLT